MDILDIGQLGTITDYIKSYKNIKPIIILSNNMKMVWK